MVVVAQLVRAPDCGSGGRRFEPGLPPKFLDVRILFYLSLLLGKPNKNGRSIFIFQTIIEDCEVCCNPIEFHISISENELVEIIPNSLEQ